MYKIKTFLKNGQVLCTIAENLLINRDALNGKLTGLEFKNAKGGDLPYYIDPDEVIAITCEYMDDGEEDEDAEHGEEPGDR